VHPRENPGYAYDFRGVSPFAFLHFLFLSLHPLYPSLFLVLKWPSNLAKGYGGAPINTFSVNLEPMERVWWLQMCPVCVERNLKIEANLVVSECMPPYAAVIVRLLNFA